MLHVYICAEKCVLLSWLHLMLCSFEYITPEVSMDAKNSIFTHFCKGVGK